MVKKEECLNIDGVYLFNDAGYFDILKRFDEIKIHPSIETPIM